jgi:hypothetical protein
MVTSSSSNDSMANSIVLLSISTATLFPCVVACAEHFSDIESNALSS